MNEYQKFIFEYIIEKRFLELERRDDYKRARVGLKKAEEVLCAMMSKEQQEQFEHYIDSWIALTQIELEQMYQEAIAALHKVNE